MSVTNWRKREQKRNQRQQQQSQRIDQNKIRSVIVDVLWTINNSSERTLFFFFNNFQKTRQLGKTTKCTSGHLNQLVQLFMLYSD